MKKDLGKADVDLLQATYNIIERDVELGLIEPTRLRFTIEARKKAAKELAAKGMSHRQIAKVVGASHTQIRRDLSGTNVPENGTNVPPPKLAGCTIKDLHTAVAGGRRFGCIYADPPWLYDNQGTRAATSNHYGGLTIEELCELPVGALAADDCHLHLWTTNGFLFECPRLFDAWGFEFRSSFVWVKPQIGIGNYWRNSHEFLLTAIRGDAKRFKAKNLRSWEECGRGAHSRKPERVRWFVEQASPGPYLELFARSAPDGWTAWGDEIEHSLFHLPTKEAAE